MDSYDNDFLFIDENFSVFVDTREQDRRDLKQFEILWEKLLLEESE